MPQFPLSPGVYVDEVSLFDFGLGHNASAVPVLLTSPGSTWWRTQQQPVLIRTLQDYLSLEGGSTGTASGLSLMAASEWLGTRASASTVIDTSDVPQSARPDSLEALALRAYFDNGGSACYLCPADRLVEIAALQDVSLVVQAGQSKAVIADILTLCQPATGRFALLDGPQHPGFYSAAVLEKYLAAIAPTASAALYYPWLNARWPLEAFSGSVGTYAIPPSAVAAGLMMATDNQEGPWRAPANLPISNGLTPQVKVGDAGQRAFTSQDFTAPSVNMFREFPGKGTLLSGARTLTNSGPAWGYINVRRTFDRVERDLQQSMQRFLFEPNGPASWEALRAAVDNYLYGLFRQQAFAGQSPQTSYRVDIGLGSTMTQQDIQAGVLRMRIGLAVVKPAEFVFLEFSQLLGGASLTGSPALPEPRPAPVVNYVPAPQQPREYDLIESARLGSSVGMSADGRTVIFGSSSTINRGAYICQQKSDGKWQQLWENTGSQKNDANQYALSEDGTAAFIGLPGDQMVYFTRRTEEGWPALMEWQQVVPENLPETVPLNGYGGTLAISPDGTRLAVYASKASDKAMYLSGAVHIWYYQNNAWQYKQMLAPETPQGEGRFGYQMRFNQSGDQLVIFTKTPEGNDKDSISVTTCTLDETGVTDQQPEWLPTRGKSFASVHPSGNLLVIGNPEVDSYTGRAQLYIRQEEGWQAGPELIANQQPGDHFGEKSIFSPDGNTLVVHASSANGQSGTKNSGKVWIFQLLDEEWELKQVIQAPEDKGFSFSNGLATNSNASRLFIGEPGYGTEDVKSTGRVWIYDKE